MADLRPVAGQNPYDTTFNNLWAVSHFNDGTVPVPGDYLMGIRWKIGNTISQDDPVVELIAGSNVALFLVST